MPHLLNIDEIFCKKEEVIGKNPHFRNITFVLCGGVHSTRVEISTRWFQSTTETNWIKATNKIKTDTLVSPLPYNEEQVNFLDCNAN